MLKALIIIAGVTVTFCLGLIAFSVFLNAWGTVSSNFIYPLQMEMMRWAFGILATSTTVLSLGGLMQIRKAEIDKAELEIAWEEKHDTTIPPFGKALCPPDKLQNAMDCAEIESISAEKFHTRTEKADKTAEAITEAEVITVDNQLDILFTNKPTPYNGELSIVPGEMFLQQEEKKP